jgi:hypothetical protein
MEESKPFRTLININVQFTKGQTFSLDKKIVEMEKIPYKEAIGCIMYSMIITRPNVVTIVRTRNQLM